MSINQLVENLLGFGNKLNNDPGLKQGSAFNSMQKQIVDQTLPALPLMEETTMPGIGSIVESLSNQESAESPLKNVDKREFKALQKLETEFNQKLTQYVAAYKAQLQHITSATSESSAAPLTCRAKEGALGPHGTGGSNTWSQKGSYYETCYDTNTRKGNTIPRKNTYQCDYGNEQPICPQQARGQGSQKPVSSKQNTRLAEQVEQLNNELLGISNRMWLQIQNLHTTDAELQKNLRSKRSILRKQMQNLQNHHQQHNQIRRGGATLEGEIQSNNLQVNSLYLQYLVWFFAASTLVVVTFHQVTKKS